MEPVKNQQLLIHAFAEFVKEHEDYKLEFFGKGSLEEELWELAKALGIEEKVVFHGFCANVKEKIHDSSMFVLCSNYEGVSNSMIEALAMGIPVIATDCPVGGARSCIKHGENGLLIPVGDQEALTKCMIELAENNELSERLSVNAEKIREKCTVERIANQMLQALEI